MTDHHDGSATLAPRHQSFNGKHSWAVITAHSADSTTPEIAAERRDRAHMNLRQLRPDQYRLTSSRIRPATASSACATNNGFGSGSSLE